MALIPRCSCRYILNFYPNFNGASTPLSNPIHHLENKKRMERMRAKEKIC
jgi:hypothetical protein